MILKQAASVSVRRQVQRARHDTDGYHRVPTSNRHGMLCLVRVSPRADISGSVVAVGCGVQVWASLGIYRLLYRDALDEPPGGLLVERKKLTTSSADRSSLLLNSWRLGLRSLAISATLIWFILGLSGPCRQQIGCQSKAAQWSAVLLHRVLFRKATDSSFRLREHCKGVQSGPHLSLESS